MGTINSKKIVDQIVANDGYYADDPRVVRIVEYTNAWGGQCYGIEHERELGTYRESEFVCDPKVYWEAE